MKYILGKYLKNTDTCVYVFDSKAKETMKRASDVDLVFDCCEKVLLHVY
jgi:predicted nucleotidyltransferase